MRLAFSYKFLVVQFYKVEMKIRPCVPHVHADEIKDEKKGMGRCALKSETGGKKWRLTADDNKKVKQI